MKANLLALLTTLLITHLSLSARIIEVLNYDVKLKIEEGESFRLIHYGPAGSYGTQLMWDYENENGDNNTTVVLARSSSDQFTFSPLILEGPGWLYKNNHSMTATVEILPTSEMQKYLPGGGGSSSSSSASGEQKNVTVIPENTPSNVQITLEQSTDLVNWSVVQPGSFAPSTTKRFFRIRSEQE